MKKIFFIIVACLVLFLGCFSANVGAADIDVAQQYAPILYFEKDEECFPVDMLYHIENSYLYQVESSQPVDTTPSVEKLSNYMADEYYLDNQVGSVNDDDIINDYKTKNLEYLVYARVHSSGETTIIQYWMFYAFNKGTMNQHEGDWEMVQVVLASGTPTQVMYSQHHSGQKATWSQVEKEDDHIKVYVSRGSHANYLRSFSGVVGVANDIVGDSGKKLTLADYNLVMLESQPWLDFGGRWGEYGNTQEEATEASFLGQAGPNGPKYRENGAMWDNPLSWGNNLIPADNNIFILEMILYNFVTIFFILSVIILCILMIRIYRRYKKTSLGPRVISMLYIDGFNAKSIGNILCIAGIAIAIFSLINPWYVISTDIGISGYETHGMVDMMTIDGINGIQIQVPGLTGPIPIGSLMIPFSLLIAISLVFLIIASIGISHSKKLGRKYMFRGIRLLVPVVLIIIIVMGLGMIPFESMADTGSSSVNIEEVLGAISGSPFGGQKIVTVPDINGQIDLRWGLGIGGQLLLVSGLILIISGFLESYANTEFFTDKTLDKTKKTGTETSKKQKLELKKKLEENKEVEPSELEKPEGQPKEKIEENESPKPEDSEKIEK
ncbi:MAG: Vps62-related protein [Thermoplasmatales archaeon]|nr:Vps62-related protein [Thermoplasmatales archaeon]